MKGQSKEMIEITVLIISVSIVLILSYFLFSSRTRQERLFGVEQHSYERLSHTIIGYFYAKPVARRSLVQVLGDAIDSGEEIVDYGTEEVDIKGLTYDYFDNYFGRDHWHLSIPPNLRADVAIVSDTSSSMKQSVEQIKEKIPEMAGVIAGMGDIRIVFYPIEETDSVNCRMFEGKETHYFKCLELLDCELREDKKEDWGDAVACVAEKLEPQIIIVLGDEMSRSTNTRDGSCCEDGPRRPTWSDDSMMRGKIVSERYHVKTFVLRPYFDCGDCGRSCKSKIEDCMRKPGDVIRCLGDYTDHTCNRCCRCIECMEKTQEQMEDFTGDPDRVFLLTQTSDAGEEIKKIIEEEIAVKGFEWGYDIPDNKDLNTFPLKVPLPGREGTYVNATLYVW